MPIPSCSGGCTNPPLPVSFDPCAPSIFGGQITKFYVTQLGNPMTDWTDTAEWTSRIDNTAAAADAILSFTVIGSKAAPSFTEIDLSGCRKVVISKEHSITYTIDEVNTTNVEFFRANECGGSFLLLGYETVSGLLFGYGNEGVEVSLIGDPIVPESKEELITIQGTLSWDSKFSPEFIQTPVV